MKKCTWCGKEYPEGAEKCLVDGEPLTGAEESGTNLQSCSQNRLTELHTAAPTDYVPRSGFEVSATPQFLHLSHLDGAFEWVEGYSRPNWKLIRETIKRTVPSEKAAEAWAEAAVQWARQLRSDLGGAYRVTWSREFVLLSAQTPEKAEELLGFAERTLVQIYALLKEAGWQWGYGKHVILLFDDEEDYYQYVSFFYREGVHPASGGCLIHKGYVHIAMSYHDGRHLRVTLAHELMHNSVVHLRLPLWLNEGLAVAFDRTVANYRSQILDGDLKERHLAFWNVRNIQRFWSGVSFGVAGESNELSYSLAEIVLNLLMEGGRELGGFLQAARWEDAGQDAALKTLGMDLGQVAGTFLGEGDWRPNRKAMAECRKEENEAARDRGGEGEPRKNP